MRSECVFFWFSRERLVFGSSHSEAQLADTASGDEERAGGPLAELIWILGERSVYLKWPVGINIYIIYVNKTLMCSGLHLLVF